MWPADSVLLRRREPALRRWLERRAVDLLARLPASADLRDELRHALASQMTAGDISIDAKTAVFAMMENELWAHLRKDIEISGRA